MSTPSVARRDKLTAEPTDRHLRLVRPPATEPPHSSAPSDGAPTSVHAPRSAADTVPVQGTLALLFTLPGGVPAEPTPPPRVGRVTHRRPLARDIGVDVDLDDDRPPPTPTPSAELPDPRRWSARLVQAVIEVRHGSRPAAQLLRWTTREAYECAVADARTPQVARRVVRNRARPIVRSLHLSEPADGVIEACATVLDGARTRAIAVRLEGFDGRWLCTALDVL